MADNKVLVPSSGNHLPSVRYDAEKKLGIVYYTSCIDFGWHGDIRRR